MKLRVVLSSVFVFLLTFVACDTSSDQDRFVRTYTEVVITREQYPDNAAADPKVDSIIISNGYTKDSFRKTFVELSKNPTAFRSMMDSVHALAQREATR